MSVLSKYTPTLAHPAPGSYGAVSGSGSPEGVIPAGIGQLYWDYTGNVLYVKDSGVGLTGWAAV